jgi:hypothetical protein
LYGHWTHCHWQPCHTLLLNDGHRLTSRWVCCF